MPKVDFVYEPVKKGRGSGRRTPFEFHFDDDEDWGYLFGYFIGDGCFFSRNNQVAWVCELAHADYVKSLLQGKLPGLHISDFNRSSVRDLKVSNRGFRDLLLRLGFKQGARHKEIPDFLMASSASCIRALLQGLFDSDGGIHLNHRKGLVPVLKVTYSSTSDVLIRQIIALLGGLGIEIHLYRIGAKSPLHADGQQLVITSKKNMRYFRDKVGFRLERKRLLLEDNGSLIDVS